MKNGILCVTSWREVIKTRIVPITLTILIGMVATYVYFTVLTQVYDRTAIERYYWGTWGFGGYICALSFVGFLMSLKASYKLSLLCSIGMPILFIIIIFFAVASASTPIRIPQYAVLANQSPNRVYVYNEMVSFGIYIYIVSPIAGSFAFFVSYSACLIKRARNAKSYARKTLELSQIP